MSAQTAVTDAAGRVLAYIGQALADLFLSPGSTFSLLSLAVALAVSVAFLVVRRKRRSRLRLRALWRALFPRRIWRHASTRADIGYLLLNTFITGSLIGWALLSGGAIRNGTMTLLTHLFGTAPAASLPVWASSTLLTVVLFVTYEFAYWLDHYLMHRVSWLWEFHRIHHTAEVLTPLTANRMHPVDSLIFSNICALVIGPVYGVMTYALGAGAHEALISGKNIILVAFLCATVHLQHSHIRLAFTGVWGRIIFSPAHHHIHHSDDPRHYNTNLGSCLAIWDWLFGTLVMPEPAQRLRFGTHAAQEDPHSAAGGLIHPFLQSAQILTKPLRGLIRRPAAPVPEIEKA